MEQTKETSMTGITTNMKLVLWNDNVNSLERIVLAPVTILNHTPEQAEQCAWIAHHKGRAVIKDGGDLDALLAAKEMFSINEINVTLE